MAEMMLNTQDRLIDGLRFERLLIASYIDGDDDDRREAYRIAREYLAAEGWVDCTHGPAWGELMRDDDTVEIENWLGADVGHPGMRVVVARIERHILGPPEARDRWKHSNPSRPGGPNQET